MKRALCPCLLTAILFAGVFTAQAADDPPMLSTFDAGESATLDWQQGFTQTVRGGCKAFTLRNIKPGRVYTRIVRGVSKDACTFALSGTETRQTGVPTPPQGDLAVYNFIRDGGDLIVAGMTGFR